MRSFVCALVIASLAVLTLPIQAATETERLVTLARVWAAARYGHPWFLERPIRWDEALFRAIPKVRAANDDAAFEAAIASMLAEIGDPASLVTDPETPLAEGRIATTPFGRTDGDFYVMTAGRVIDEAGPFAFLDLAEKNAEEISNARYVIVDLRTANRNVHLPILDVIAPMFTRTALSTPARWTVTHSGYAPERGGSSGGYYSGFTVYPGDPVDGAASERFERVAFIVSAHSPLPGVVLAMRSAGNAVIVAEAPLTEAVFANTMDVPLGTGRAAVIRVDDVAAHVQADAVVAGPEATSRARELVKSAPKPSTTVRTVPTPIRVVNDAYASQQELPPVEMRLLAAFRLWSVIDRFYPYKHLIGDWNGAFARSIPDFMSATTRRDYVGAILKLAAAVEDGHTTVSGPGIPAFFGEHFLSAEVRLVRGELVVTALGEASQKAGLRIGDVVLSVDGESLRDRIQRLHPYVTASTPTARTNRLARYALRGPSGSTAKLVVQRSGAKVELSIPRSQGFALLESTAPLYRMIAEDIGYADLTRLRSENVEAMFKELSAAKSIVFDMRGYPHGAAWSVGPRLGTGEPRVAARFSRPQTGAPGLSREETSFMFAQTIPDGRDLDRFQGRTYMLIDDRAISQAEHTGLFFETANGTEFIGTPTAGANGDVTRLILPGDIEVAFSGHDVRHANGDQLQRVGLKPAVHVEPTIEGLAAGKDEVLDAAVQHIRKTQR